MIMKAGLSLKKKRHFRSNAMSCNGDCNQGRECDCECKKETKMTTKDEALRMVIELMERFLEHDSISSSDYIDVRNACIKALEPTVAELNDEYLRDTHVEGMPKEPYNLVAILNDPMKAYPHNFSTPAKANALLFGLCQEAADEIERLKEKVK